MFKYIIFDLGNVLVHIHPERTMQAFMNQCGLTPEQVKSFYLSELHLGFMEGRFEPDEFYHLMMKKFPCDLDISSFISNWNQVIGKAKAGIEPLINALSAGYTLAVCSNTDPWHWEKAVRENSFLNKFEYYFLSFQIKRNKPDPYIFERVLTSLKANAGECLFIDDIQENIEVARKLGFTGLHTQDPAQIRAALKEWHVLKANDF